MDSPAAQSAVAVEAIKKIPLPTVETFEPNVLSAAAAVFAIAVRKEQAADQAIARLQAEQLARDARIAEIDAALDRTADQPPIDIWCANFSDRLAIGSTVQTMEVPGHWLNEPTLQTTILNAGSSQAETIIWYDRSINIAPNGVDWPAHGDLHPAEGMSDAAVAYNLAMEPGHLKWHPAWRYGILTSVADGTVTLNEESARRFTNDLEEPMPLNQAATLQGVKIVYPPCNANAFRDGDEVLVVFEGQQQQNPVIVGFRKEPRACPKSWQQLR